MSTFMEHIHRDADALPVYGDTAWTSPAEYEGPSADRQPGSQPPTPRARVDVVDVREVERAPRVRADAVR
jgi:hypothetical protein